jgi:hypothetical protein
LKTDKHIRDISDRLNRISCNDNGRDDIIDFEDYDDEYHLEVGSEPLRFAYYRRVRVEQCNDEYRKKTFECVYDSITQDELDYYLKRKLRVPPEQRYQDKKKNWFSMSQAGVVEGWTQPDTMARAAINLQAAYRTVSFIFQMVGLKMTK